MAEPMSIKPTDSESNAYLRDPACGVPFDIRFEIEDKEGTSLGIVGGHKTILGLKSPVFKAMLFGSLAEVGDLVKIRDTSMFAFTEMLNYIYGVPSVSLPWSKEVRDLFLIADLAEKYNLPGLMGETVSYAEDYVFAFRQEQLIEIVKTAEGFHVFEELSEALLGRCAAFLEALLETPGDMNNFVRAWSGKDAEDMGAAFRLLARVDHSRLAYAYNDVTSQEVFSHLCNIIQFVRPRHRLQQLKALLEAEGPRGKKMLKGIKLSDFYYDPSESATIFGFCAYVFIDDSLRYSQMKDKEKASQNGVALTLDTLVEDNFTHEMSIRLHLEMISFMMDCGQERLGKEHIEAMWNIVFESCKTKAIPQVQTMVLSWLANNPNIINGGGHDCLSDKLKSCDETVKALPEYNNACDVYE